MSKQITVDMYAGSLVFWKGRMVKKETLDKLNEELGLSVSWKEIPAAKALEKSLYDRYGRTGALIRPTKPFVFKGSDGQDRPAPSFVVVHETKEESANSYDCKHRFFIDTELADGSAGYEVWILPDDQSQPPQLATDVNAAKYYGMVSATRVSAGLDDVVMKLNGYQLRDNARVYFLSQAVMSDWKSKAARFAAETGIEFYQANCPADADTAAAVAENASVILKAKWEGIMESIMSIDNELATEPTAPTKKVQRLNLKRAKFESELESIKQEAARLDASFNGLINVAGDITASIDQALALAILATASN
jgi:hypothetical protein